MSTGLQPRHLKGFSANHGSNIAITPIKYPTLTSNVIGRLRENSQNRAIGIAGEYLNDSTEPLQLRRLAFATESHVVVIEFSHWRSSDVDPNADSEEEDGFSSNPTASCLAAVLQNPDQMFTAFHADRLALALHLSLGQTISNLIDLQSSVEVTSTKPRNSPLSFAALLGGPENVHANPLQELFADELENLVAPHGLAFRAWSAFIAQFHNGLDAILHEVPKINTCTINSELLHVLAKIFSDHKRLEAYKPVRVETKIDKELDVEDGIMTTATKYQNEKLRVGSQQKIFIRIKGKKFPYVARVESADHNCIKFRVKCPVGTESVEVVSILQIGPEDPTLTDTIKSKVILWTLQNSCTLFETPVAKSIWLGRSPGQVVSPHPEFVDEFAASLNETQRDALKLMLSESEDIQLPVIVGPPGTGKTTVISAFVRALDASHCPVWVVAQSNVGVKNIASRLLKDDFWDWRLLIAREFYRGWNEKLYEDIPAENRIISDDFTFNATQRQLGKARVILCTLSLLSNASLYRYGFLRTVPMQILVVDEASQIELGSFVPVLSRHRGIRKICFFGDDKQLAPFMADQISDLTSIFEVPHLREKAVLLNTQYRIPAGIADFISSTMYSGELYSQHSNRLLSSCQFIDIENGEEELIGSSYRNILEIKAVKNLVKAADKLGLDFRVLTPYEGQRSVLEGYLQCVTTNVKDKVFNVDSFQGNEADIIIISLVRTREIGFLSNLRRLNVMLTRCKVKMFICCNMRFLETTAADTLMGKMALHWKDSGEIAIDPSVAAWERLFDGLRPNTLGKMKAKVRGGRSQQLDLGKVGYGTVLKPNSNRDANPTSAASRRTGQRGRGARDGGKASSHKKKQKERRYESKGSEWEDPSELGWGGQDAEERWDLKEVWGKDEDWGWDKSWGNQEDWGWEDSGAGKST